MARTCVPTVLADCLAETLELDPADIHEGLAMGTVPQWDSLGHVNLMFALEARYNVRIPVEQIQELTSLQAIIRYTEALAVEETS